MTGVLEIGQYSLECEYTFTFFPTHASASLQVPRIRGGRLIPSWQEVTADSFTHGPEYTIGVGGNDEGESLTVNENVIAWITITLNRSRNYEVDLKVSVGKADSRGVRKSFELAPDSRVPYMLYRRTRGGDEETQGTAAVLQGVLTTSSMYGQTVRVKGPR